MQTVQIEGKATGANNLNQDYCLSYPRQVANEGQWRRFRWSIREEGCWRSVVVVVTFQVARVCWHPVLSLLAFASLHCSTRQVDNPS